MKKIAITALAFVSSAAVYWQIRSCAVQEKSPPAPRMHASTLLACNGVQVTYIKNQWGTMTLNTPRAYLTHDRLLYATYLEGSLLLKEQDAVHFKATDAIFDIKKQLLCSSQVQAETLNGALRTDRLAFNINTQELSCSGGVQSVFLAKKI